MNLPNFLIVGAAKAGTTALYDTLQRHPGFFMSPVKETHYFGFEGEPPVFPGPSGDYFHKTAVWRPHDYAMLFARAAAGQAIGEASPVYLMRSAVAAPRIRQTLPRCRIVAVLRHPVERAYSDYNSRRMYRVEPAHTFREALAQESARARKGWILGRYRLSSGYHAQLSDYYALFPREQIRICLYEDWKGDAPAMLRDLFRFLEVDENAAPEIRRSHVTRLPRNRRLHRWAQHPDNLEKCLPFLPLRVQRTLASLLRFTDERFNLAPPPPLAPAERASLTEEFRTDILKLQDLIRRDLSSWLDG